MSSSSSPALALELRHGLRLIPAGTLLLVVMLLPWVGHAGTPAIAIVVMLVGVALATLAGWQAGIGNAARRLTRIAWSQNGDWRLQFATGEPVTAALAASSWRSPWLMCWRWVDESGHRHGLLLWRCEVFPDSWHQWQLRLRLEGTAGSVATEPQR